MKRGGVRVHLDVIFFNEAAFNGTGTHGMAGIKEGKPNCLLKRLWRARPAAVLRAAQPDQVVKGRKLWAWIVLICVAAAAVGTVLKLARVHFLQDCMPHSSCEVTEAVTVAAVGAPRSILPRAMLNGRLLRPHLGGVAWVICQQTGESLAAAQRRE